MLTFRMKELLDYIAAYQHEHGGVSPNYSEMAAGIRLKSKSNIARLLDNLEGRGHVRRLPRHARAIEVRPKRDWIEP